MSTPLDHASRPPMGLLSEADFRRRLAFLIETHDAAHPDVGTYEEGEGDPEWQRDWETLLRRTTDEQGNRALALLSLHVQNSHA